MKPLVDHQTEIVAPPMGGPASYTNYPLERVPADPVLPFEGIRVSGAPWSSASLHMRNSLGRNHIPHEWLDLAPDGEARALVDGQADGSTQPPMVVFQYGDVHRNPSHAELAEGAGLRTRAAPSSRRSCRSPGPTRTAARHRRARRRRRTTTLERRSGGRSARRPAPRSA